MGNWYANISVKGARPTDVLSELNELGRPVRKDAVPRFDRKGRARQVRSILNRPRGFLSLLTLVKIRLAYVFEIERHQDLAGLLAMPAASVGLGYTYVERGEFVPGMQAGTVLRTYGRPFR
jgi:hypothetical protein